MKHSHKLFGFKFFGLGLFASFVLLIGLFAVPKKAEAACTRCCNCEKIRNYIVSEVGKHETWLVSDFWAKNLQPALTAMANQITSALSAQSASIGGFVNAQNNAAALRSLQELSAESATNYMPSEQLCRFGSLGQSLGASDARARSVQLALSERAQARQLGKGNMQSAFSSNTDMRARMIQYMGRYCDATDNNGRLTNLCKNSGQDQFLNSDVDFTSTFDAKPTLNVNFAQSGGTTGATDDEQNIASLSDNLFGNELFPRPSAEDLNSGAKGMNDARVAYMDMRALLAKRSVAQNSFNTLIGMKAKGTAGSKQYIAGVLKDLGMSDKAVISYLGENPSYNAQMEVLTKKLYQSPNFYVNLMENPANVERQYAAMQSFGLMQQRDIFETIQRSEMLLSLILEMELSGGYQNEIQSSLDNRR